MRTLILLTFAALVIFTPPPSLRAQEDLAVRMENAIKLMRSTGNAEPRVIALMLMSCAEGYIQKNDFDTALLRIKESIKMCREHDIDPMASFFTATKILSKTDDQIATDFLFAELTAPGTSTQYRKGVLKAMELHLALNGDQKLAIQAAYELWQIAQQENPDSADESQALFNFGIKCLTGKLFDLAGPALKDARAMALKAKRPDLAANCSRSLGFAISAEGNYEQALKLFQEAANFSANSPDQLLLGFELQTIATTQLQLNRLDDAEKTIAALEKLSKSEFERSLAVTMSASVALKRALAGNAEKIDLAPVIELQKQAVELQLSNTGGGEAMALLSATQGHISLASLQILSGDLDAAEQSLAMANKGADAWEQNSRNAQKSAVFSADQVNLSIADIRSGIYEFQQQIDVLLGNAVAALVTTENSRGTAQAELLKEKLGLPTSDRVVKTLDAAAIAGIAKEHDTTLVIYSLVHSLASDARRFFAQKDRHQRPEYLYIWVVSPDGKMNFQSVALKGAIGELVDLARQEIISPPEQAAKVSPLKVLSSVLIDPIREHLPAEEGSLITFVPQGQLFLVPFAALPAADGSHLIDRYVISLTPSIELLSLAKEQKKAVDEAGLKDILIVGNPTMPGYQSRPDRDATSLSPLPGAEAEAKFLAKALNVEPLIGDAATEQAVTQRMEQARFLHFATHGLLEDTTGYNQSFLSALAFAASPGEDGFLTVKETARMNLRAELAVLSACDTGRGSISGDGVIGLSRGYITAGVPSVVVSLWPVSDQATAVLMSNYYRAMVGGQPKAAALRSAILETKKKFPAPNLWAPFELYGLAK